MMTNIFHPRLMRKQLDPRIPTLINNNVKQNHRSFIVLVGDRGRDQVSSREGCKDTTINFFSLSDSQPSLFTLSGASICSAFCIMVLQKRFGIHKVQCRVNVLDHDHHSQSHSVVTARKERPKSNEMSNVVSGKQMNRIRLRYLLR
jgi:hypothetical protein